MHIFRLRPLHYCMVATIFFICSAGFFIDDLWLYRILLSICIIAIAVGLIDSLKTSIVVDNESIRKNGLFKKQEILIKEVERILLMPTSKGKKIFVGVYGNQKKLFITFWYKDYKRLLKLLLERFKENNSVKIDPKVLEIVKEV